MNIPPNEMAPSTANARGLYSNQSDVENSNFNHIGWQAARELIEAGIPVFPCKPNKAPYVERGFKAATTSLDQVGVWERSFPDALIAVPTGKQSGLLVVDIDPEGQDWYSEHSQELRCGRIHRTKRGHHLLYKLPDSKISNFSEISSSVSKLAKGVDVRAEGGYIIWWPATGLHTVGELEDVTYPPEWLVGLLHQNEQPISVKSNHHFLIAEGGRNDFLSKEAFRQKKSGASTDQI